MDEKKQIEEMATVIKSSLDDLGRGNFNFTGDEFSTMVAKKLYNADCRKQSEGEWVANPLMNFLIICTESAEKNTEVGLGTYPTL